jgi:hypothetical protein
LDQHAEHSHELGALLRGAGVSAHRDADVADELIANEASGDAESGCTIIGVSANLVWAIIAVAMCFTDVAFSADS